jgi:hypothetical protein
MHLLPCGVSSEVMIIQDVIANCGGALPNNRAVHQFACL